MNKKLMFLTILLSIFNSLNSMPSIETQTDFKTQTIATQTNPFMESEENCILALEYFKKGNEENSFSLIKSETCKNYPPAFMFLAIIYFHMDNLEKSIKSLDSWLRLSDQIEDIHDYTTDEILLLLLKKTISIDSPMRKKLEFIEYNYKNFIKLLNEIEKEKETAINPPPIGFYN